jgi:hypothetical protein
VVGNFSKSLTAWAELRDSNDKARAIEVRWQGSQYSVVSWGGPITVARRQIAACTSGNKINNFEFYLR